MVPPGCGNGHFVLSDDCTFHYKLAFDGDYNDIDKQFVIKWDDEMWGFEWHTINPYYLGGTDDKRTRKYTETDDKSFLIDFETEIKEIYEDGKITAPVHLSGGNEDQLIEIFKDVDKDDWVFSSWRNHYHGYYMVFQERL